jgi:hypothetical protein
MKGIYVGDGKVVLAKELSVSLEEAKEQINSAIENLQKLLNDVENKDDSEKVPYHWANQFYYMNKQVKRAHMNMNMGFEDSYY